MVLYDVMSLDGTSLLQMPFNTRRKLMYWTFGGCLVDGALCEHTCQLRGFGFARHEIYIPNASGHDTVRLRQHLQASFEHHCEGLMIKVLGIPATHVVRGTDEDTTSVHRHMQARWDEQSRALLATIYPAPSTSPAPLSYCAGMHPDGSGMGAPTCSAAGFPVKSGSATGSVSATTATEGSAGEGSGTGGSSATYEPAKRCTNWVKIKKDYMDGTDDTLDVVPLGAWWGNGRKAGWYSPFLLAVYVLSRVISAVG